MLDLLFVLVLSYLELFAICLRGNRYETPRKGAFLTQMHQISGRIFSRLLRITVFTTSPHRKNPLCPVAKDDVPIHRLASETSLKKSTLTVMLDALERSGHIIRIPSWEDRRRIHVRLTDKNRGLWNVYARVSRQMTSLGYAGFSDSEIDTFEGMLERILANLKSAEEALNGKGASSEGGKA